MGGIRDQIRACAEGGSSLLCRAEAEDGRWSSRGSGLALRSLTEGPCVRRWWWCSCAEGRWSACRWLAAGRCLGRMQGGRMGKIPPSRRVSALGKDDAFRCQYDPSRQASHPHQPRPNSLYTCISDAARCTHPSLPHKWRQHLAPMHASSAPAAPANQRGFS